MVLSAGEIHRGKRLKGENVRCKEKILDKKNSFLYDSRGEDNE